MTRACSRCRVEKPVDAEHYNRKTSNPDGFYRMCRDCRKATRRGHSEARPKGGGGGRWDTVPAEPLRPFLLNDPRTHVDLSEVSGVSERLIQRIRKDQERINVDTADKLCIALGTHLTLLYDYDDEQAAA